MGAAQISPMLAVGEPAAAIAFYKRAFGATEVWVIGEPAEVALLDVYGASLFLARAQAASPRAPDAAGHTTVRIELLWMTRRPCWHARWLSPGSPRRTFDPANTHSPNPPGGTLRMLQGGFTDPFGHIWLIGKFVTEVPRPAETELRDYSSGPR